MKTVFIFAWIWAAMVAMGFWEAYVEGRNAWDRGKFGWKIRVGRYVVMTAYHFSIFVVMLPLLLTLPFIIYGWDTRLFGIILSAYVSGTTLEDFVWYLVNPVVKVSELNTDFANYYPRLKFGKIRVPITYFSSIIIAILSWYFLWR